MSTFGKCQGGGRRTAKRSKVPLIAVVMTLTESRSAVVVDISATGARLRAKDLPQEGCELFLTLEGVVVFGTVAWSRRSECGIAFDGKLKALMSVCCVTRLFRRADCRPTSGPSSMTGPSASRVERRDDLSGWEKSTLSVLSASTDRFWAGRIGVYVAP